MFVFFPQGPQRPAPHGGLLLMERVKEAASPVGRGGMGGGRGVYHSLWDPPRPGHFLQVSRDNYLGGGQRLDSGG